jgi:hypothetical protein
LLYDLSLRMRQSEIKTVHFQHMPPELTPHSHFLATVLCDDIARQRSANVLIQTIPGPLLGNVYARNTRAVEEAILHRPCQG